MERMTGIMVEQGFLVVMFNNDTPKDRQYEMFMSRDEAAQYVSDHIGKYDVIQFKSVPVHCFDAEETDA